MSQYKAFLESIEELVIDNTPKIELEDVMKIHPSMTVESPELWCYFLSVRPDLSEDEVSDIKEIIKRLQKNQAIQFQALMNDFKKKQAERPEVIPPSECIITPLEPIELQPIES